MPEPAQYHARLTGKSAIVTGGGATVEGGMGIGAAIALLLAREGAHVCVVDRDEERARYTAGLISRDGAKGLAVIGDVSQGRCAHEAVSTALSSTGRVDILINNAAVRGGSDDLTTLGEEEIQRVLDVNFKSAVIFSKACLPKMISQAWGSIVSISSIGASLSHGSGFLYGPAKAALGALTRDIAVAYGRQGIRANLVSPGHMFTPMVSDFDVKTRVRRRDIAPLGIEGDAWDIAAATLFLVTDGARFITGQDIIVDGGVSALSPLKGVELAALSG